MTHASIPASDQGTVQTGEQVTNLAARVRGGASWFYWIAALSVINSVVIHFHGQWGFAVGLGITQVFDAIAMGVGEAGGSGAGMVATVIALGFDVFAAAVVALFGFLAAREKGWAFIVGGTLYAMDGLIFLIVQDWMGLGLHALALFFIANGFLALRELRATRS